MFDRGVRPRSVLHNEMGTLLEKLDARMIDDLSSRMFFCCLTGFVFMFSGTIQSVRLYMTVPAEGLKGVTSPFFV